MRRALRTSDPVWTRRWPTRAAQPVPAVRKIVESHWLHALYGGGGARSHAARNRGIVWADRAGQTETSGRKEISAGRGCRGAPLHGVAPVDREACPESLISSSSPFVEGEDVRDELLQAPARRRRFPRRTT